MQIYDLILQKKIKISVIGLGYVGLPIAVSFAEHVDVIGFDINREKVKLYKAGIDPTNEVGDEKIQKTCVKFTSDEFKLKNARFHIIAVPTPINKDKIPDLSLVENASKLLGSQLMKDSIVVYESTVYPGVTEDICIPILERESGLKCGEDFWVGYSPERINPGDKEHRLENIIKIVSGIDEETKEEIAKVYEIIIHAGVYRAESIKVAEAAKVIENSQRDINIAFMNELSLIFHKLGIDTKAVLKAAGTKWNFLNFVPGLVGGHCIGVDPYYLTYKAEQIGYHSQVILSGRRVNDDMGKEIIKELLRTMIAQDLKIKGAKIAVLGLTFKENCPDIRNTRVIDIIEELELYEMKPIIVDSVAERNDEIYLKDKLILENCKMLHDISATIIAVAHDDFKELKTEEIRKFYKIGMQKKIIFDIKGILDVKNFDEDFIYWAL